MNTPYHDIEELLNLSAQSEYVVKDCFEVAVKVNLKLFDNISDNILMYRLMLHLYLQTSCQRKLLDAFAKTTFSFSKKLYYQIDGVSTGSPMANVIMIEFEHVW